MKKLLRETLFILSSSCLVLTSVTSFGLNLDDESSLVVTGTPQAMGSLMELKTVKEDPTLKARISGAGKSSPRAKSQATAMTSWSSNSISTIALNDSTFPAMSSSLKNESEKSVLKKRWGMSFQISETAGLYERRDGKREKSADMELGTSYKLTPENTLSAKISGSIDQNDYENNDMGGASISFSRKATEFVTSETHRNMFSLAPYLSLGLPISKAQKDQSFRGGVSPGVRLEVGEDLLPSKRLSMTFGLKATRNFFYYEHAVSGASNSQYSSSQTFDVGYDLPADFQISLNLSHFNSWTFQGNPGESFSHSEEIGKKLSNSLSLALGHQFGAPAASIFKADGQTYNFDLVNENDSYVYAALTYRY